MNPTETMATDLTIGLHLAYLLTAVPLTAWVGQILRKHGNAFLADVFPAQPPLAVAVNRLLLVGFYLLNFGLILMFVSAGGRVYSMTALLESLSVKLGFVMLFVGAVHVVNVLIFNGIRRRHLAPQVRYAPMYPQPFPQQQPPFQQPQR